MTRTVAQVVAPQTCQSTPNSHTANAFNPTLQKLWRTLVPHLSVDMAEFIVSSPESNIRLNDKKQELRVFFTDIRGFTWRRVEPNLSAQPLERIQLKGRTEPVGAYSVQQLSTPN